MLFVLVIIYNKKMIEKNDKINENKSLEKEIIRKD